MNIAVFAPQANAYSETFVRHHIERLPGHVTALFGGSFHWSHDRSMLLPLHWRAINRLDRVFPHRLVTHARLRMHDALAQFLLDSRIQVALAEYATTALNLMDACAAAGVPLVVHCHGSDVYDRNLTEPHFRSYQQLFSAAASFVVVSKGMQQHLSAAGAPECKVHCIPCGVDCERFRPTDAAANGPVLLAVGRFVEKKAPDLTIRAFARLLSTHPNAKLIMIGDGPLLGPSTALAESLGISRAIEFRGSQPHSEVASALRQARVFVQHSVRASTGDSEGTPVGILEAGATAVPVVSTFHAGITEAVLHEETGFLVEERDVDAMVSSIGRLLADPQLARRLGQAGRDHVMKHYSSKDSIAKLHNVLKLAAKPTVNGSARLAV